jgi:hypothetical protein
MGKVIYTGINNVDCVYKLFSIRTFLHFKDYERIDRKNEKLKEKHRKLKIEGIKIKGTKKRVRVKPELCNNFTYFPYVKSLPKDCVIQNGDKVKIIYKYKVGEIYSNESSDYEIIEGKGK